MRKQINSETVKVKEEPAEPSNFDERIASLEQQMEKIKELIVKLAQIQTGSATPQQPQPINAPVDQQAQQNQTQVLELLTNFMKPQQPPAESLESLAMTVLKSNIDMNRGFQEWFMKKALKD